VAYYLDLFSPETYEAFKRSTQDVSGFRLRHKAIAARVKAGDKLVCYMTKFMRWFGVLEVIEGPYIDDAPIFYPEADPFVVRFKVKPLVLLDAEKSIPIHEDSVWETLSFTKGLNKKSTAWTGIVRGSLVQMKDSDGRFLEKILTDQVKGVKKYPVDEDEYKKLVTHTVRRADKIVMVSVPEEPKIAEETERVPEKESRESIKIQSLLAEIGARMGLSIWIPKADRAAVLKIWKDKSGNLIERLPLNYDDTTLKTIEQIDVLWLKGRSIVRAFEVEHTTSVYSGILRMADLLALQPNMDINLHIVAPAEKREKVFQEIRRPVFSLLERKPLAETCTFLSYDSVRQLSEEKHLSHLSDTVLNEYVEEAE